ncbi:MAG: DNA polymerase III subunit beta [Candidatus Delongbacteria bacterium]|nr:DNA polymerase III subunit beta [Candidatus Delongbacteria bacterium]MBN2834811.1 DNA polymerase III subunit beta [Candidatus Delongbacteria bacterium]
MKFKILRSLMNEQMGIINPILPSRSTKPIAECIMLKLEGNNLNITATDLSYTYVSNVEVEGSEDGIVIVPGKKFFSIIKGLPEGEVTLIKEENSLLIIMGRIKFEVSVSENPQDFPQVPENLEKNKMIIESLRLKKYIEKVNYASSNDELRAVLTGSLFSIKNNELTMVATDSVRLVKIVDKHINFEGDDIDVIIPSRSLDLISSTIIKNIDCEMYIGENYVEIRLEKAHIFTRLINGKYPAYQSIIPVNNDLVVSIDRSKLIASITRVSISCHPVTKIIKFVFNNDELFLSAEDSNTSSRGEEILSIDYKHDEISMGFNSSKISEILKSIDSDLINFNMSVPGRPIIIKPSESNDNYDIMALLMPVKVEPLKK